MQVQNLLTLETSDAVSISSAEPNERQIQISSTGNLLDRDQVLLPIAPSDSLSDEVLYQDPSGDTKTYYLPRYQIAKETVSEQVRYRIKMAQHGSGWKLTIWLSGFVAESLISKVGDATPLDHDLSVFLRYTQNTKSHEFKFDETQFNADVVQASLQLSTIELRDQVFTAISDTTLNAELLVHRSINVAVPTTIEEPIESSDKAMVVLESLGNKIGTIKAIRLWLNTDLRQSKDLAEKPLPTTLIKDMPLDRAKGFVEELNKAGSRATLKTHSGRTPPILKPRLVDVWLKKSTANSSQVVKVLEKFANLHPREATQLLRKPLPLKVLSSVSINLARIVVSELAKVGATASLSLASARTLSTVLQPTALVKPILKYLGASDVDIRGVKFTRHEFAVTNVGDFSDGLFVASPELPPCGANTKASRTWVDILDQNKKRVYGYCALSKASSLSKLSFSVKHGSSAPTSISLVLNDRKTRSVVTSEPLKLVAEQTQQVTKYQIVDSLMEQVIAPQPFHFDHRLHGYIYEFLDAPSGGELIRHEFQYQGRPHSYFVDANNRALAYYFPDSFKIARWNRAPHTPRMSVQINSRDDDSGLSDVVMSYLTQPVLDQNRIQQAASTLSAINQAAGHDHPVKMQPYPVSDYSFRISHPTANGNNNVDVDVSASVFYEGVQHTLTMELADFIPSFAALLGTTAAAFHGTVNVTVSEETKIVLPFVADFTDLSGNVFEHAVMKNDDASISLSLINTIESDLNIESLQVTLVNDNHSTATTIVSTPPLPAVLVSGNTLSMQLIPDQVGHEDLPYTAIIDTSGVSVIANYDAIFSAIIDRSTTDYFGWVRVRVAPSVFQSRPDNAGREVVAIIVHFESSGGLQSVELNPDVVDAQIKVAYSVDDLVIRNQTSISYRYWFQVARADGSTDTFEGVEQSADDFFLNVAHLNGA